MLILPIAKGRFLVRSTDISKRLSNKSLITHPALRIIIAPKINMQTIVGLGLPLPAIHNAINIGHDSKKIPIGLFKRIKRISNIIS